MSNPNPYSSDCVFPTILLATPTLITRDSASSHESTAMDASTAKQTSDSDENKEHDDDFLDGMHKKKRKFSQTIFENAY
eukprot:13706520-Ditylum_brightwellii.AAC.1